MKYFIIDDFIEKNLCDHLIQDAKTMVQDKGFVNINVNRKHLVSSSLEFGSLVENSSHWKTLTDKIDSDSFLSFCKTKLDINEKMYLTNFFKIKSPSDSDISFKSLSNQKVKSISTSALVKYSFYRLYKNLLRKIKFSKMFFSKKLPVELLYDYSIAGDGYFREIHRDSDSRMIVFLLYLSSLPNETKGGSLDIFKLKENAKETLARPDPSMCEKIESITPKPGRLVVFKNDNNSYHSVEKLSDSKSSRYFIYGGFTLLSQNNPFITKGKLKTEFNFFE